MADSDGFKERIGSMELTPVPPANRLPTLADDARAGLLTKPRTLPPKYFYDARGSELFDGICRTEEYYPTRDEASLLADAAPDIARRIQPSSLLELGAGASRKTGLLLAAFSTSRYPLYVPYDICPEIMISAGQRLMAEHPGLTVHALVGDYHAGFDHLPGLRHPVLWAFLGGTVGNFERAEANDFLAQLHGAMAPGDWLLLGADRLKEPAIMEAAYNDRAGWTAAFNLNVLRVLNRELGAEFDLNAFYHQANFNGTERQIEMYLVSDRAQRVPVRSIDMVLDLAEGESIRTEISRKFTREELEALIHRAGFGTLRHYETGNGGFSLILAER